MLVEIVPLLTEDPVAVPLPVEGAVAVLLLTEDSVAAPVLTEDAVAVLLLTEDPVSGVDVTPLVLCDMLVGAPVGDADALQAVTTGNSTSMTKPCHKISPPRI
jgi:hypothetical protein